MSSSASGTQIVLIVSGVLTLLAILPVVLHKCFKYCAEIIKNWSDAKEKRVIIGRLSSKQPHRNVSEFTLQSLTPKECVFYAEKISIEKIVQPYGFSRRAGPTEIAHELQNAKFEAHSDYGSGSDSKCLGTSPKQQMSQMSHFSDFSFQSVNFDNSSSCDKSTSDLRLEHQTALPGHGTAKSQESDLQMHRPGEQEQRRPSRLLESSGALLLEQSQSRRPSRQWEKNSGSLLQVSSGSSSRRPSEQDGRRRSSLLEINEETTVQRSASSFRRPSEQDSRRPLEQESRRPSLLEKHETFSTFRPTAKTQRNDERCVERADGNRCDKEVDPILAQSTIDIEEV